MSAYCTAPCDVTGKLRQDMEYHTSAWLSQRPLPNPNHDADLIGLTENSNNDGFVEGMETYSTNRAPMIRYHSTGPAEFERFPMDVSCSHTGVSHLYESPQLDQRNNVLFVNS